MPCGRLRKPPVKETESKTHPNGQGQLKGHVGWSRLSSWNWLFTQARGFQPSQFTCIFRISISGGNEKIGLMSLWPRGSHGFLFLKRFNSLLWIGKFLLFRSLAPSPISFLIAEGSSAVRTQACLLTAASLLTKLANCHPFNRMCLLFYSRAVSCFHFQIPDAVMKIQSQFNRFLSPPMLLFPIFLPIWRKSKLIYPYSLLQLLLLNWDSHWHRQQKLVREFI